MTRTKICLAMLTAVVCAGLAPMPASAAPGPPDAPEWWFDAWHVESLWAAGHDGRGITVAVADTGVQGDIAALEGKVLPGADFIGNGSDGRVDFDEDDFSHGTAMASIIAASRGAFDVTGVAPGAKILPIALPLRGVIRHGGQVKADATTESIRYAADHGARIISMSLGGIRDEKTDNVPCPPGMQDAVVHALQKDAIVVAASGNSGESGSPVEEPGVCLGVVSVGAVDAAKAAAPFSSRHPYLTIAAPGDDVPSLSRFDGRAFVGSGTSQATAIASAAIALVWSAYPKESSRQILTRVLSTANDLGPKGRDDAYGAGLIDPVAAIQSQEPATNAPNLVLDAVRPLLTLASSTVKKPATKAPAGNPKAPLGTVRATADVSTLGPEFQRLVYYTGGLGVAGLALLGFGLRRRKT